MMCKTSKLIIASSVLLITFINCSSKKEESEYSELYWKFSHTIQKVDAVSDQIKFMPSAKRITESEVDTLVVILKEWGWENYLAQDSVLLIRKYGKDIMNNMRVLDDELYRRMKYSENRNILN